MKKNRHKKILSLIQEYNIDRQEVLLEYLNNAGFAVTQATVSRDIKELNLVKIVSSTGEYKYAQNTIVEDTKATFNRFDYIFSESIKSVDYALNTVVIKCHTAMAQAACEVFDSLKWDGVVGTIAGENTIFILMRTEDMAHKLNDKLKQYIK
ncbi:MAG: arginine repressor [Oscillospiraceae bacterium]|jgi:transcriptional regulator of arginine metabolism|nr:arginine repressor [Oscillospiraceae bacterium]MBQ5312623.1 arginine repressor [Oscillospiraceae bacterium]MBQ5325210.1 arginine repressor [Oscillospiraceae bacterium]